MLPLWHLVVVDLEPPLYLLRSPFWSSKPKLADKNGYLRLTLKQLGNWSNIFLPAIAQAECVIRRGEMEAESWEQILEQLFVNAGRSAPEAQNEIILVRDFLWYTLTGIAQKKKIETGELLVKFFHLVSEAKIVFGKKLPAKSLFLSTMRSIGMSRIILNHQRWWKIDMGLLSELGPSRKPEKNESVLPEQNLPANDPGWINGYVYYLMGALSGLVKIGWAISPFKRMRELQTGSAEPLQMLVCVPCGSSDEETKAHERFKDLRQHGDWFVPEEPLLKEIEEHLATYGNCVGFKDYDGYLVSQR